MGKVNEVWYVVQVIHHRAGEDVPEQKCTPKTRELILRRATAISTKMAVNRQGCHLY